jgi:hypothetical protein
MGGTSLGGGRHGTPLVRKLFQLLVDSSDVIEHVGQFAAELFPRMEAMLSGMEQSQTGYLLMQVFDVQQSRFTGAL